jgi:hypothetical protein
MALLAQVQQTSIVQRSSGFGFFKILKEWVGGFLERTGEEVLDLGLG